MKRLLTIVFLVVCFAASAEHRDSLAQNEKHSVRKSEYPVLGVWKHSYFATGFATNQPITKNSSDVKFQLSVALRLWSIKEKVDIFATYSQRSVWDIYQKSSPFRETAYSPGLWVAWRTGEKVRLLFGFEHESNGIGLESGQSRSFNYATVACLYEPLDN